MSNAALKNTDDSPCEEVEAYREWAESFRSAMETDVEPLSLVDYNVAAFLDYSRAMGVPEEAIERDYRPCIREGYRRAHARALSKFEAASAAGDLIRMEKAMADLIGAGLRLGLTLKQIGQKYRGLIVEGFERGRQASLLKVPQDPEDSPLIGLDQDGLDPIYNLEVL